MAALILGPHGVWGAQAKKRGLRIKVRNERRRDKDRGEEGQHYGRKKDVNAIRTGTNYGLLPWQWQRKKGKRRRQVKNLYVHTASAPSCRGRKDVSSPLRLLPMLRSVTCVAFPQWPTWRGPTKSQVSRFHFRYV